MQHKEAYQLIKEAWSITYDGSTMYKDTKRITNCRVRLLKWHNSKIGIAKKKIEEAKEKLERIKEQYRKISKE